MSAPISIVPPSITQSIHARLSGEFRALADPAFDLQLQVELGGLPLPDGRRAVIAQLIVSCASTVIGHRLWEIFDVPIDIATDPGRSAEIAGDIVALFREARSSMLAVPS